MNVRWIASIVGVCAGAVVTAACCCDGPFCEIPKCDPCAPRCPCPPAPTAAPAPTVQPVTKAEAAKPAEPAAKADAAKPADATAKKDAPKTVGKDVGHMHNVHQVTPKVVRGSQPETEHDFEELAKMGVKVVVSVDGARPDIESAKKHGIRYVHVPMGYDGPSREEQVLLYKAFTELEGPFFVHCHHGKHRGPAACTIALMVEGWTPEQTVAELKRAGTAAKYEGLYAFPASFQKPTAEELAAVRELPEVAPVPGFVGLMVQVDHGWERLGFVKKAKWQAPSDHPDVAPKHEATIMAERFREMARMGDVTKSPAMLKHAQDSETAAWDLAKALEASPVDATKAAEAFGRIEQACTACHKQFRDTPTANAAR